jgi:hypothetical protein
LHGASVMLADLNGDGLADVVTALRGGAPARVRVFSARGPAPLADFLAFGPDFRGSLRLAVGDVTGDGRADILAVSRPLHIRGFRSLDLRLLLEVLAPGARNFGGVNVPI